MPSALIRIGSDQPGLYIISIDEEVLFGMEIGGDKIEAALMATDGWGPDT